MKEIRFVITTEFPFSRTREYLIAWDANYTIDSPEGLTWTSWEVFEKCNKEILANGNLGLSTIFKTYADAEDFAKKFYIKQYKIIEVLFDTNIQHKNGIEPVGNYYTPGISPQAFNAII